jgi:hypothetical protein
MGHREDRRSRPELQKEMARKKCGATVSPIEDQKIYGRIPGIFLATVPFAGRHHVIFFAIARKITCYTFIARSAAAFE